MNFGDDETDDIDYDEIARIGGGTNYAVSKNEEEDPDLLAELAALMSDDDDDDELKALEEQPGDGGDGDGLAALEAFASGAVEKKQVVAAAKTREKKPLAAAPVSQPSVAPSSERAVAAPPVSVAPSAERVAAVAAPSALLERVAALKREALACKQSGDVQGALSKMRMAKALERGEGPVATALDRVAKAAESDQQRWAGLAEAAQAAMKACAAEAKRQVASNEADHARALATRARELRKLASAASARAHEGAHKCPTWRRTMVPVSRERIIDSEVPPDSLALHIEAFQFAAEQDSSKWPKSCKVKWELSTGDSTSKGETSTSLTAEETVRKLRFAFPTDAIVKLDPKLAAASKKVRRGELAGPADKTAFARFDRAKLSLEVELGFGGSIFRRRPPEFLKSRLPLEGLATSTKISTAGCKFRCADSMPEGGLVSRKCASGSTLECTLRLREPIKTAEFAQQREREEVIVEGWAPPEDDDHKAPPAKAEAKVVDKVPAPPSTEQRDPHAAELCVSDKVLEHEIAACPQDSDDIDVITRRLALETAAAVLVAKVNSGKLSVEAYVEVVKARKSADLVLVRWLVSAKRREDAARVARRIKLMDAELTECDAF